MSDSYICIIPRDPFFVPAPGAMEEAEAYFAQIAPEAEEIESEVAEEVMLRDCGGNLESIRCPICEEELPTETWHQLMDEHWDGEAFDLRPVELPCGHRAGSLNGLRYHFDMGFSRAIVEAMNANIGQLTPEQVARFGEILGGPVKVIYQHL